MPAEWPSVAIAILLEAVSSSWPCCPWSVQPTPFQRDLSPTHTKRLAQSIEQAGSFLDPLIVVPAEDGGF